MRFPTNKGFSLIELVMLVVITTTAALIITPNILQNTEIFVVESEARKFAMYLIEMRQRAIARQQYCGAWLDSLNNIYVIRCGDGVSWTETIDTVDLGAQGIDLATSIWDPAGEITFDPYGDPLEYAGFAIRVSIAIPNVSTRDVLVDDISGNVHLREPV